MDAASFKADPSDPDAAGTARKAKVAPAPPEPKKDIEPPKSVEAPTDDLSMEEGSQPAAAKTTPEPKPEDEVISDDELKSSKPPSQAGPWKLKKYWEKRAATVELENNQLKERLAKLPDVEKASKNIEAIQKRNQELEEEIKYTNFSKSKEYEEKYQKPYEAAWAKAAKELGELEVLDESGAVARRANSQDLIALANMPLGQARKTATAMFGDSANDVMLHRQRIIDLSEAQREALDNARKSGSDRQEQFSVQQQALAKEVSTLWEQSNTEAASKIEYLKAKEGDDEWNGALDKAKSLVDTAFAQSPADPRLNPEQRAKLVKSHAAIRNRAIAYSALKLENNRLRAQMKERDEKLKQFEDSAPTGGNGSREGAQATPAATPMERMKQRMQAQAVAAPPNFY